MVKLLTPPRGNVSQANFQQQDPLLVPIVVEGLTPSLIEVRRVPDAPSAATRPMRGRRRALRLLLGTSYKEKGHPHSRPVRQGRSLAQADFRIAPCVPLGNMPVHKHLPNARHVPLANLGTTKG